MTATVLIEKVREELGTLEVPAEQVVALAEKFLQSAEAKPAPQTAEEKFISRNITPEEYEALTSSGKSLYLGDAEQLNRRWIEKQFKKLDVNWIMVIDGQVVLSGAKLRDYPEYEDLLALCERHGKYPFVFVSQRALAIEEGKSGWHGTREPADAYPTVPIALAGNKNRLATESDLDTGAADCYSSLELLTTHGVVTIQSKEARLTSEHLGQKYFYYVKLIWIELTDDRGEIRQRRASVVCVENWQNSPFIEINPTRTFLLGRAVLFELQPRLVLDFAAKCTEVQYSEAAS